MQRSHYCNPENYIKSYIVITKSQYYALLHQALLLPFTTPELTSWRTCLLGLCDSGDFSAFLWRLLKKGKYMMQFKPDFVQWPAETAGTDGLCGHRPQKNFYYQFSHVLLT